MFQAGPLVIRNTNLKTLSLFAHLLNINTAKNNFYVEGNNSYSMAIYG